MHAEWCARTPSPDRREDSPDRVALQSPVLVAARCDCCRPASGTRVGNDNADVAPVIGSLAVARRALPSLQSPWPQSRVPCLLAHGQTGSATSRGRALLDVEVSGGPVL